MQPAHPSINCIAQHGLEDASFTKALGNTTMGRANTLEESCSGSYLYAKSAIAEIGSLISLGILVFPGEETKE